MQKKNWKSIFQHFLSLTLSPQQISFSYLGLLSLNYILIDIALQRFLAMVLNFFFAERTENGPETVQNEFEKYIWLYWYLINTMLSKN